jgi:[acyl-carrier-protein] S-malonyltransferase
MVNTKVTYAACYPGQGAQKPKMALDLYEQSSGVRNLFEIASDAVGKNLFNVLDTADEASLQQTELTQVVVTLANRSAATVLQERGLQFACHAGFSLGELSAYAATGVLTEESLFSIVAKRGELMAQATEAAMKRYGQLAMAAIVGVGFSTVERVLSEQKARMLYCANDNSPTQVVISGLASEIERCSEALKQSGARRIIPLKVSGPFHTPLMQDAAAEFAEFLQNFTFSDPKAPLYVTVSGTQVYTGNDVREQCIKQLSSPVRWTRILQDISETKGVTRALEIGPGTTLSGFWKASGIPINCTSVGTYEEIRSVSEEEGNG